MIIVILHSLIVLENVTGLLKSPRQNKKITNYYYIIQYCYFPTTISVEHQVGWIFDRKVSPAFFPVYRILHA
jgi:hypothetical protein